MRLLLVRHGESVDNVAGLFAGSRDSALTAHGMLQAQRLGSHLAARPLCIRHVFSSDLVRARATAEAICSSGAAASKAASGAVKAPLAVVTSADLCERDFRSAEGTPFSRRKKREEGATVVDDAETRKEMQVRVGRFFDEHLVPLLVQLCKEEGDSLGGGIAPSSDPAIVIVSHGMLLNVLLESLLQPSSPQEYLGLSGQVQRGVGGQQKSRPSMMLVSWSNTGYLELVVRRRAVQADAKLDAKQDTGLLGLQDLSMTVTTVNAVDHLRSLKRTAGGIGSASFDPKQRKMDSFFAKRQRRSDKDDEKTG